MPWKKRSPSYSLRLSKINHLGSLERHETARKKFILTEGWLRQRPGIPCWRRVSCWIPWGRSNRTCWQSNNWWGKFWWRNWPVWWYRPRIHFWGTTTTTLKVNVRFLVWKYLRLFTMNPRSNKSNSCYILHFYLLILDLQSRFHVCPLSRFGHKVCNVLLSKKG